MLLALDGGWGVAGIRQARVGVLISANVHLSVQAEKGRKKAQARLSLKKEKGILKERTEVLKRFLRKINKKKHTSAL